MQRALTITARWQRIDEFCFYWCFNAQFAILSVVPSQPLPRNKHESESLRGETLVVCQSSHLGDAFNETENGVMGARRGPRSLVHKRANSLFRFIDAAMVLKPYFNQVLFSGRINPRSSNSGWNSLLKTRLLPELNEHGSHDPSFRDLREAIAAASQAKKSSPLFLRGALRQSVRLGPF
jgi:hypothetical protein